MDEVSGMVLDKSDFDLAQLIRECIETAKLHSQKAISVVFQTRAPAVMYFGDAAHIKNVLSNLLDNAIKYSDEDVQIAVELTEDDDNLKIQVTDQGQGIPSNYMNDIFDMFFRVPKGNLHAVKGFGLGLSYVRQIVEKHGGRIAVSSKVGEGSTFTIFLPKTS
ncbi:MAG TPA: HAMP domain-containing sensor histidine kinase, partial [Sphingobacterium sp.]|nr:HAMP domain-containing sensor histidine kinase [Sphingobacterium sp.]